MDRWKSRGGKSLRREEKKREDQRRERVRRKKMQVRKKVEKSRCTVFYTAIALNEASDARCAPPTSDISDIYGASGFFF